MCAAVLTFSTNYVLSHVHQCYTQQTKKKRRRKPKGVKYEDEDSDVEDSTLAPDLHGHPTWRMEDRNPVQSKRIIC